MAHPEPILDPDTIDSLVGAFEVIRSGGQPFGRLEMVVPEPELPPPAKKKPAAPKASDNATLAAPTVAQPALPRWPTGPVANDRPLSAGLVEQVVMTLLADPAVGMGVDHPLVQRVMLEAGCDGPTIGRYTVPILLWLAEAGVITQAEGAAPWTQPCHLALADTDAIRAALHRTRRPTAAEVDAAKEVIKRVKTK